MIWNRVLTGGSVALAQAKREVLRRHRRESSEDVVLTYSTAVDSVTDSFDHDPFGSTLMAHPFALAMQLDRAASLRPGPLSIDVEVRATDDAYEFTADLPGVRMSDLEITVEGGPQGLMQAIAFASVPEAERTYIQLVSLVATCCMTAHTVASIDRGFDATRDWQIVEVRA